MVLLLGTQWSLALAEEVGCPGTIVVNQSLAKQRPGWVAGVSDRPVQLASLTFFDGPPEQKASLVYDSWKRIQGKNVAVWTFSTERPTWFSCGYSATGIVISRALPKGTLKCTVTYSLKETIDGLPHIEEMHCK